MHKRKISSSKDVQPLLLTISQVAAILNVGRTTVYDLIHREGLPSVPLGGRNLRVSRESLEQWIQKREIHP